MKSPDVKPPTIGVFDSGVGGLTVLREIIRRIPTRHNVGLQVAKIQKSVPINNVAAGVIDHQIDFRPFRLAGRR